MDTTTCGKCVPSDEHKKLWRQWVCMCWLCVVLMGVTAVAGVLALEWRERLSETRVALDKSTELLMARELADHKELKVKPAKVKRARHGHLPE